MNINTWNRAIQDTLVAVEAAYEQFKSSQDTEYWFWL